MALADRSGLPVAVCIESATPHEVKLVESTLVQMVVPEAPQNLIGDNAYDSDKLDAELKPYGIEVIAPHRSNRKNKTQDGRRLRRYKRRWKVERLFAWLQNFRRIVVRHDRHVLNYLSGSSEYMSHRGFEPTVVRQQSRFPSGLPRRQPIEIGQEALHHFLNGWILTIGTDRLFAAAPQ